jgi:hypothetical protein
MAVVQSGRLTAGDTTMAARLVAAAAELSAQKTFLPEACTQVICSTCTLVGAKGVESHLIEALKPLINVSPRQCTAAGLTVILHLENNKLVKDITAALPMWVGVQSPILQAPLPTRCSMDLLRAPGSSSSRFCRGDPSTDGSWCLLGGEPSQAGGSSPGFDGGSP